MSNNDVWAVLSMQQTPGRPFCEELSENNRRRFGVPTRLPQPFVSAARRRESDSEILLSFQIAGTVTAQRCTNRSLLSAWVFLQKREISQWLAQRAAWIVIYQLSQRNHSLLRNLPSPWSLIYKEQHPHSHINKLKLYSTYLKPSYAVHKDPGCMQFLSQVVARVRRTCA